MYWGYLLIKFYTQTYSYRLDTFTMMSENHIFNWGAHIFDDWIIFSSTLPFAPGKKELVQTSVDDMT